MAIILGKIHIKESMRLGVSYDIMSAVIHKFSTEKPN